MPKAVSRRRWQKAWDTEQRLTIGLDLGDRAGAACWTKRETCCRNKGFRESMDKLTVALMHIG
jgi:hypothetical protein